MLSEVLMVACLPLGSAWSSLTSFRVLMLLALQFCFSQALSLPTHSMSWSLVNGTNTIQVYQLQFTKVSAYSISTKMILPSMQESNQSSKLARTSQPLVRFKWLVISLTVPSVLCKWWTILTQLISWVLSLPIQSIAPFIGCTVMFQPSVSPLTTWDACKLFWMCGKIQLATHLALMLATESQKSPLV